MSLILYNLQFLKFYMCTVWTSCMVSLNFNIDFKKKKLRMISFMLVILLIAQHANKPCKEISYFILFYLMVQSLIWWLSFMLQFSVIMVILFALPAFLNLWTTVTSAHCPLAQNVAKSLTIYRILSKCHARMKNMAAVRQ